MSSNLSYILGTAFSLLLIIGCAKRGSITGGPKDETPPKFLKSTPPNYSTDFKAKEIRIYFDELITLENPQQQIIVSPPMKEKPTITPLGTASRFIKIKFNDTLKANTTYSINFGASVVDYNEKNPFNFFQYVFSTGKVLDSLTFKGSVKDAISKNTDDYVSVFLYELNKSYNDSAVFKHPPRYIASTLDSTLFQFQNLKKGKYQLLALKDRNSNYLYEPTLDKIAFITDTINIPQDSVAALTLFKQEPEFKFNRVKQVSKHQFIIGYQGKLENPEITVLGRTPKGLTTKVFKDLEQDTLRFWAKPFFKQDSLVFKLKSAKTVDTLVSRYKDQYKDSLNLKMISKTSLRLQEDIVLTANTPIQKLDESFVSLYDKDTVKLPFTQKRDALKNQIAIKFNKKEASQYALKILPGAITDFVGNKNDTIVFNVKTKKIAEYGKLFITVNKIKKWPLIIQLLSTKEEVIAEKSLKKLNKQVVFDEVAPANYNIRVIVDSNANGIWDSGNYLQKIQPEKVIYHPKLIKIRANWDVKQVISITQ